MMNRPVKFTPQVIENIKELVVEGINRDEIAKRLGVTVRSLQVHAQDLVLRLALPTGERRKYRNPQPGGRSRNSDPARYPDLVNAISRLRPAGRLRRRGLLRRGQGRARVAGRRDQHDSAS